MQSQFSNISKTCLRSRLIIIDFPQILSLGHVGYRPTVGKLSLISLRLCHLVVLVREQNFFFGQHKSWNTFLLSREAQIFFPEFSIKLYDKNSESDYFSTKQQTFQVKWSVPYGTTVGKLSLISLRLCHLVMLVMVNYH
jgi:hypothetical protein